jgi:hypothetical protein
VAAKVEADDVLLDHARLDGQGAGVGVVGVALGRAKITLAMGGLEVDRGDQPAGCGEPPTLW